MRPLWRLAVAFVISTGNSLPQDSARTMVSIPGGVFLMGADSGIGDPDETPAHEVELSAFFLDRTEVTNAAYAVCVEAGACEPAHYGDSTCFSRIGFDWEKGAAAEVFQREAHPVVCVDWLQADSYCRWRGDRLPTEAEWELAARGGGGEYTFGNELQEVCLHANIADTALLDVYPEWWWDISPCNDSHAFTAPVASLLPDRNGIHDLGGNAWEWVQDWYLPNYYRESPRRDPKGPEMGQGKSLRGASWSNKPHYLRVTNRYRSDPRKPYANIGFRCARDVSKETSRQ